MQWVVLWVSVQGKSEGPNQNRRRCLMSGTHQKKAFDLLQSANDSLQTVAG